MALMAMNKKEGRELEWIEKQQLLHDRDGYSVNRAAVGDELVEQQRRHDEIDKFGSDHRLASKDMKHDLSSLTAEQQAFLKLQISAGQRLDCLKMVSQIDRLEDPFATLTNQFALTATDLVDKHCSDEDCHPQPGVTSDQGSIQAVRSNWRWVSKLLKCADVHLQNASDYHQFFHEVQQYRQWMMNDLIKAEKLVQRKDVHPNTHAQIANELLLEMKTAITLFLQWNKRIDGVFERSKTLVPVHQRAKKLDYAVPAKALCSYKTTEITIAEGEELTLVENSSVQQWQVQTSRAHTADVPSTIILIPGPDPAALQAALKLRLQFLALWTMEVKRIGKSIVWFLLQVIRDWTPEEEKMLRNLNDVDKKDLTELLAAIEKTFSLYWQHYPPYNTLQDRGSALDTLLHDKSADNQLVGKMLVIQTGIVIELLAKYREFWHNWELFKILTEITRHPEFLLVAENWKDYKFAELPEWLKKWQLENADWEMVDGDKRESVALVEEERLEEERLEEEKYLMERAKETAEMSHLTSSEQEETSSFVITSVLDPRTNEEISFDEAIGKGIINQREGTYVNTRTRESVPIQMAMNAGKIKVEVTTTKKTAERRKDLALITIKTIIESRPFVVRAVIDAKTEKRLDVDEAVKTKILDQKRRIYVNSITKEELTLADALDSGLLEVEFEKDLNNGNGEEEAVTKTYAVHAVVDVKTKKRLSFREAIDQNIFEPDEGSYLNTATGEKLYVGDAIRKGLIKATVVHDVNAIDPKSVSAANRMTIGDDAITHFHKNFSNQVKAASAFKRAGKQ